VDHPDPPDPPDEEDDWDDGDDDENPIKLSYVLLGILVLTTPTLILLMWIAVAIKYLFGSYE